MRIPIIWLFDEFNCNLWETIFEATKFLKKYIFSGRKIFHAYELNPLATWIAKVLKFHNWAMYEWVMGLCPFEY